MLEWIERFDESVIRALRRVSMPLARGALFTVFFWFGILKIIAESPAEPLIGKLLAVTLPFLMVSQFMVFFGLYEMCIGVAFLIPRLERLAIALLIPHMIATALPLFLLPERTWQSVLVPTLEGQYIIKNVLIIALALSIAARLTPFDFKRSSKSS